MLIDVHTHAFPDRIALRAVESLAQRAGLPSPGLAGTISGLTASMDRAGIACSWVANIATRPGQAGAILEWSKAIRSQRIEPLGSVHPESADWQGELRRIGDAGLLGIKLHPQHQGFAIDEPRLYPLYQLASELGLCVLFHAGYDLAFGNDDRAAPRRLARVLRDVPGLCAIAAHLGGYQAWEEALQCLVGTDVYLDTSFMHHATREQRENILRYHARSRVLFGSDSPWTTQSDALDHLRELSLADDHKAQIAGGNAQRLTNLLTERRQQS